MKRIVAMMTEKAWAEGQIQSSDDLANLAEKIFLQLSSLNPLSRGNLERGRPEILKDIAQTLRVLSYGQRGPKALAPHRFARVSTEVAAFWKRAA